MFRAGCACGGEVCLSVARSQVFEFEVEVWELACGARFRSAEYLVFEVGKADFCLRVA